jgi:hypothetical protein
VESFVRKESTCEGAIATFYQEDSMRTLALAIAAAAIVATGFFAKPAAAITLSGSDGLRHAIEDTDLTDKVHCRPGWRHHLRRWGWWDGCYRSSYFYSYPRYHYRHRVHIGSSFVHRRAHVSRSFTRAHISRGVSHRSHGRRR